MALTLNKNASTILDEGNLLWDNGGDHITAVIYY